MQATTKIPVDLVRKGILPVVQAVQNDKNTRYLALPLTVNNQAWTPPEGTIAVVRYRKPDGRGGEYDLLPDGSPAYSFKENVVTVALAPQVLTTVGPVRLNVGLINGEKEISTFRIQLNVGPNVYAELVDSEDYYNTSWVNAAIAQLQADVADLQYDVIGPISITSVTASPSMVEVGSTVDLTITWALNRDPVAQTVDGVAVPLMDRSAVFGAVGADRTVYVEATDERDATARKGATIKFVPGLYYGALAYGTAIDSAAILGLAKKLKTGRALDFTIDAGGLRPVYALPTRYGTPTFKIGGFTYEWEKVATLDFENSCGHVESYDVWMHGQDVSGSITVNVT